MGQFRLFHTGQNLEYPTTKSLESIKEESKKVAKELFYPAVIMDRIDSASTIDAVYRVLHDARFGHFNIE